VKGNRISFRPVEKERQRKEVSYHSAETTKTLTARPEARENYRMAAKRNRGRPALPFTTFSLMAASKPKSTPFS